MYKILLMLITLFLLLTSVSCTLDTSDSTTESTSDYTIDVDTLPDTDTEAPEKTTDESETTTQIVDVVSQGKPILSCFSPDFKYFLTAWFKTNENSTPKSEFSEMRLIDVATGETIISLDGNFYDTNIQWTRDSRYVAIMESYEYAKYANDILVLDTVKKSVTVMPRIEIQNMIHSEVSDKVHLYSCDLCSYEWSSNDNLNIGFDMKTGAKFYTKSHPGSYIYNMTEGKITALKHSVEEEAPAVVDMTAEEIAALIDRNLSIIVDEDSELYRLNDFIAAHSDEFEEIVALGEAALPYLIERSKKEITDVGDYTEYCRNLVSRASAFMIKPELYEHIYQSLDKKLDLRKSIADFDSTVEGYPIFTYNIDIIDHDTGDILISDKSAEYYNIKVYWSPDNCNAAVVNTYPRNLAEMIIFNITNRETISMPIYEVMEIVYNEVPELEEQPVTYRSIWLDLDEWLSDNSIKIKFDCYISDALIENVVNKVNGFYIYDLQNRSISDVEYVPTIYCTEEREPYDEVSQKIKDNLDIILNDDVEFTTEHDLIAAHQNEFSEIVALGEAALPYLNEISNMYYYIEYDDPRRYRCLMACAAAYAIKPELYDIVYYSPDGKYVCKLTVGSFFGMEGEFYSIEYNNISIIERETGEVISEINGNYHRINVKWSPDSRYAEVSESHNRIFYSVTVFDIENGCVIIMPDEEVAAMALTEFDNASTVLSYDAFLNEWYENGMIRVSIAVSVEVGDNKENLAGYYIYDLLEGKLVEVELHK